jgi:hypothetical protein
MLPERRYRSRSLILSSLTMILTGMGGLPGKNSAPLVSTWKNPTSQDPPRVRFLPPDENWKTLFPWYVMSKKTAFSIYGVRMRRQEPYTLQHAAYSPASVWRVYPSDRDISVNCVLFKSQRRRSLVLLLSSHAPDGNSSNGSDRIEKRSPFLAIYSSTLYAVLRGHMRPSRRGESVLIFAH